MASTHKSLSSDRDFSEGLECFFQKMYNSAVKYLSQAAHKDRTDGMTYYIRGMAFLEMGKKEQARADFQKAIDLGVPVTREYLRACDEE